MTERERKLLRGGTFDPMTQDEAAIKYAVDNAGGGGGGENKSPLIVNGTFAAGEGGNNTVTITTPLADIYAAAQAGRAVLLEYTEDGTTTRMGLVTYADDNGAYALAFSICIIMSDKPAVAAVGFENSLVGEFNIAAGQ